jgi:hypothetical protein
MFLPWRAKGTRPHREKTRRATAGTNLYTKGNCCINPCDFVSTTVTALTAGSIALPLAEKE